MKAAHSVTVSNGTHLVPAAGNIERLNSYCMLDPYQKAIAKNVMNVTKQAMPVSSMMSSIM
jgi:hypothetical protein